MTDRSEEMDVVEWLLSCPFCGGDAKSVYNGPTTIEQAAHARAWGYDYNANYWCECVVCSVAGPSATDRAYAIASWNRRAMPEPLTDEALRTLVGQTLDVLHDQMLHSEKIDAILSTIAPAIKVAERERCAGLEGSVRGFLSANGGACACGNGRVPVSAYAEACAAYARAIRNGDAS